MKDVEYSKELKCCANCMFGDTNYEPELRDGIYANDIGKTKCKGKPFHYWIWPFVTCKFNPPSAMCDGNGDPVCMFPETNGTEWCWQYKNKYGYEKCNFDEVK